MFNKKNNKVHKLSTVQAKLSEVQTTLLAFDFELLEIWSPDDGNDKEVWFNKNKNKTIEVSVLEDKDPSRQDVVNELIDIWIELKDLKDSILYFLKDEEELLPKKDLTPSEIFDNEVKKTEDDWDNNEEEVNFIYSKNVDPSVLTYLNMNENDKAKITH